jgi:hypothetical protein
MAKKGSSTGRVIGSRAQVWHGTASHTAGGLTRDKLMMNKRGRIVSKARHALGQSAIKHLEKSGHKGVLPSKRKKMKGGEMQKADNPFVGESGIMRKGKEYFLSLGGNPDVWDRKTPMEKKQYLKDNGLV